ncbi:MAG: polysaccharide biosynthesis tyrosine autokinase, partial [Actinomycetota bacterium]
MEPIEYLRAIRRHWTVVIGAVLVALVAAWFTRAVGADGTIKPSFEATTVLISSTDATTFRTTGSLGDPNTAAALVILPPIPERVAGAIGYDGRPSDLVGMIDASVDEISGLLNITATSADAARAKQLADTFATELLTSLTELREVEYAESIRDVKAEIRGLRKQIAAAGEADTRDVQAQLTQREAELNNLRSSTPSPGFHILAPAAAHPVATIGFQAPRSFGARALIAALVGLIAGAVIAFILARFDTRIRTKRMAEESFSLPVLAEIPVMHIGRDAIAAVSQPSSRSAEAFRILGAEMTRGGPSGDAGGAKAKRPPQMVLVTSAGPSEGKTTVVANLAAAFSEMGKKVLVVSCDFHRPAVHRLFGLSNEHGLTEALASQNGKPYLDGVAQETSLDDVQVVPSGSKPKSAGELLSSEAMRTALQEARKLADFVILDTPPILVASDATHLLADVDTVLLVARAGKTKGQLAERTSELLSRLDAPVTGVVLNRAAEIAMPRGYRLYYRTGDGKRE